MHDFSNEYAPEHLIIASEKASAISEKSSTQAQYFWATTAANRQETMPVDQPHPHQRLCKNYSGVSLDSFTKKSPFNRSTKKDC